MALVPTFIIVGFIILFGLVGIVFLIFSIGRTREAKALLYAFLAALAGGLVIGLVLLFAGGLLVSLGGVRQGEEAMWLWLFLIPIGAIIAAAVVFVAVFIIVLKRLQPSTTSLALKRVPFVLGILSFLVVLFNLYELFPPLHPTPKLIRDTHGMRSTWACDELSRRGEDVIPALLDALAKNPHARHAYVFPEIVADIPGETATDALIGMLEHPNQAVRAMAAWRLGLRKDKRALAAVIELLDDRRYDDLNRRKISQALMRLAEPSDIPKILGKARAPETGPGIRTDGFYYDPSFIAAIGPLRHPQTYEYLLELCTHSDTNTRETAVEQLRNYPCRRTALVLIELIDDPQLSMRRKADWIMTSVAGITWNPSTMVKYSASEFEEAHEHWLKWMEENGSTLPEEPTFDE